MKIFNSLIEKLAKKYPYFINYASIMEHNFKKYDLKMEKKYSENNLVLDEYSAKLLEKMDTAELIKVFINSKDIDLDELEDRVINSRNAKYIYHFALKIKRAPSEKLTWAICRTKNGEYIYEYATKFSNVNIAKIFVSLTELEEQKYAFLLAKSKFKEVYPFLDNWGRKLCQKNNIQCIVEYVENKFGTSTSIYRELFKKIYQSKDAKYIDRIMRLFLYSYFETRCYLEEEEESFFAKKIIEALCETEDAKYIGECCISFIEYFSIYNIFNKNYALNNLINTLCEIKDVEYIIRVCYYLIDIATNMNSDIPFNNIAFWINQLVDSLCETKNSEFILDCYRYISINDYKLCQKNMDLIDLKDKLFKALLETKDERQLLNLFDDLCLDIDLKNTLSVELEISRSFQHLEQVTIKLCESENYTLAAEHLAFYINRYRNEYKKNNYYIECTLMRIIKEILCLNDAEKLNELKKILSSAYLIKSPDELIESVKKELEEDLKIANMNNDELFSKLLDFHNQERIEDIKQKHDFFSKIFVSDQQSVYNLKRERKIKI